MIDWLNLLLRWAHLIAGIAWIGSSFYFMWLDSHLEPPPESKKDVEGELWMVHSGGFYNVERKRIGPGSMPKTLHWFKYEALLTFITGFLLLNLVYYFSGGAYLIDPNIAPISPAQGVGIGLGVLVVSWFVYDFLWQSKLAEKHGPAATAISLLLATGAAIVFCKLLSGRAAYIHFGAMLGSIMVANVWVRILPAQQKMIDATKEGRTPDFTLSDKAKRRSVHNTYMTFPVLFMMLSSHYPNTYGHPHNWIVLLLLVIFGACTRHAMIAKTSTGKWAGGAAVATLIALVTMTAPQKSSSPVSGAAVDPSTFAKVREILNTRCIACHSPKPQITQYGMVPGGTYFETAQQIHALAERIKIRAVTTKTMPMLNVTNMTDEERDVLGRWVDSGAPVTESAK